MCAVYECGYGHTETVISKYCRRNTQGDSNVPITSCQECVCGESTKSRNLNYCGLKTNAEVLTNTHCCECNSRKRVQEEKCGLCGVGIFTLRFGVRLRWIIRSTPTFFCWKQSWIILSIATICPTTNSSTSHPTETTTKKMGCFCSSCLRLPFGYSLLFTFFDNLHGQLKLMVLRYWKTLSFSLLDFQPFQMYLFTQLTWLVVFCIVTESFSHLTVPALQFGLRVSVWDHLLSVVFIFFPNDLRIRRSRSSLHLCFIGQRYLFLCIFENGLESMPSTVCSEDDPCRFPRLVCSEI